MASMVIRNIPDDVLAKLKEKARSEGKSTEQVAREALAEKARPSRDELLRRMEEIRSRSKPVDLETALRSWRRLAPNEMHGPSSRICQMIVDAKSRYIGASRRPSRTRPNLSPAHRLMRPTLDQARNCERAP